MYARQQCRTVMLGEGGAGATLPPQYREGNGRVAVGGCQGRAGGAWGGQGCAKGGQGVPMEVKGCLWRARGACGGQGGAWGGHGVP